MPADPALAEILAKGRALPPGPDRALRSMLGVPVGRDGLARALAPSFPGLKTHVVQARITPDRSVDLTLIGVARDGAPVWVAGRSFARGRDGSIELHHCSDELHPDLRRRNVHVDAVRRELDLLRGLDTGPAARVTIDAEGDTAYAAALHGFVFADETEAGPPVRSHHALAPDGDRRRWCEWAVLQLRRIGGRLGVPPDRLHEAERALIAATTPAEILQLELPGAALPVPEDEAEFVGRLGRALLLTSGAPHFRASLEVRRSDETFARGSRYRIAQSAKAETRLASEVRRALDQVERGNRSAQMRALSELGMIAPSFAAAKIRDLVRESHRGVAAAARRALRQISGGDLKERLLAYAEDPRHDGRSRGRAYRVLTEYDPARVADRVPMLRVDPDAHIQRAAIPVLLEDEAELGPALASFLAANPWTDLVTRPGLAELRMELIEALAAHPDPRAVPALMGALADDPPRAEHIALSRALVNHPDPRARRAVAAAAQRLDRPPVP